MRNDFVDDLDNAMYALEDYIISTEEHLISTNAGDAEWFRLDKYKNTLSNFRYLVSIYG